MLSELLREQVRVALARLEPKLTLPELEFAKGFSSLGSELLA